MKIAIVSDCHLNKSTFKGVMDPQYGSLPFRNVDNMKAFRYMCEKCIKDLKPDLVVIPGDIYDNHNPSNEVRGFFSTQLNKLVENGIKVIILIGNHDVCRKHHALKEIRGLGLENIKVIENTEIIELEEFNLLLFPYSLAQEKQETTAKEEFVEFIKEAKEKCNDKPKLFIGHCGIRGAKVNEYVDEVTQTTTTDSPIVEKIKRDYINNNPDDVSIDDLDDIGANYIILGDYHRHQILPTKNCVAMYTGSIERTDFSEKGQEKGFVFFDSEAEEIAEYGKCRFIQYPTPRPMLEIEGNIETIKHAFGKLDYDTYKGAIVKINFKGNSDELIKFSISLEEFKSIVQEKLNAIHIFHTQSVEDPELDKIISKLEQDILERGHMEESDVIDVAIEMIKDRVEDKEEREKTVELAHEIYGDIT